ncbi:MAG: DnaD domain protein [Oscillospiraceae bacterium]|jgi:DnaD/phage-associated family protein|nr:DnaD domain protein [Oscillospiraceae bacterium]
MNFSIKLGTLNSVFLVPASVVDEHIKIAGSAHLKVLLWLLRHANKNFTDQDIATSLSMCKSDVTDAINYWSKARVLLPFETNEAKVAKEPESKKYKTRRKFSPQTQILSPEFLAKRIQEDGKIDFLMQEAESIIGRTLSNIDSSILISIHDNDGLPVDVIVMLLRYAVSVGKQSMKYIEKLAISWAEEEIDTPQKADEKIRQLNETNRAWNILRRIIGVDKRSPTPREKEASSKWINSWHVREELIEEAYNRCVDAKGKYILGYMDTIIKSWQNKNIKTLKEAVDEKLFSKKLKSGKKRIASYDINKYKNFSVFD